MPIWPPDGSRAISLLPRPEHHVRVPWKFHCADAIPTGNPFPLLKLDIIRYDDIGKQRLDFVGRKKSARTDQK